MAATIPAQAATPDRTSLRWFPIGAVAAIVLLHFSFLMLFFEGAISTPDAHGYFAQARLLAEGGTSRLQIESPVQYVGPHWYSLPDGRCVTTFPPGLPVLLASVFKFLGPTAALVVSPLLTSLTLLGLFLVCRAWVGESWALVAALLMATNPFLNEHALFGDSHAALDFFFVWSLVFLVHWTRTNADLWAFLTGLCVGIIPTIRYPEFVLSMVIVLWALLHLQGKGISWRSLLFAGAGAIMPIGALLLRNQVLFGAFWKTGYGYLEEPSLFGWRYFASHCPAYLIQLATAGSGPTFVLGAAGIAYLTHRRATRRWGILLLALAFPLTVLYMSYFFPPDPQSMRYLLPTLFIYTIASVCLLKCIIAAHPAWAPRVAVLLVLLSAAWGLPRSVLALQHLRECNAVLEQIARLVATHAGPGSVLIAGEAVNQNLDFAGRYRLVDAKILSAGPPPESGRARTGSPSGPDQRAKNAAAAAKFGRLNGQDKFDRFAREVWGWAGTQHPVYLLGDASHVSWFKAQITDHEQLVVVGQMKLPDWRAKASIPSRQPPLRQDENHSPPTGPMGPNRIFDLTLEGQTLLLVEWKRDVRLAMSWPNMKRRQPDGAANGSQPIRSETNRAPGAAGSRR